MVLYFECLMKLLLLVGQIVWIRRSHVEDVIQMRFKLRTSVIEIFGLLWPFLDRFMIIIEWWQAKSKSKLKVYTRCMVLKSFLAQTFLDYFSRTRDSIRRSVGQLVPRLVRWLVRRLVRLLVHHVVRINAEKNTDLTWPCPPVPDWWSRVYNLVFSKD